MAAISNCFLLVILGIFSQESFAKLENAQSRQFKFQVSLRDSPGRHVCGGALITQSWVVTTVGCAEKLSLQNGYVFAGSISLIDTSLNTQYRKVRQIIKNEKFNPSTYENNIALLRLETPIEYSDYIVNVRLPIQNENLPDRASLCGWPPSTSSNRVLQVINDLKLVSQNCQINPDLTIKLNPAEFCGIDESSPIPPLLNDLGGSLTKDQVLHGLLSRTDLTSPEIFIQTSVYSNWIKDKLGNDAGDIKWDNSYTGPDDNGGDGASMAQSSIFLIALLSSLYVLNRSLYLF